MKALVRLRSTAYKLQKPLAERTNKELFEQGQNLRASGKLTFIKTPLKDYEVWFVKRWMMDFYIFDGAACIGVFALESSGIRIKGLCKSSSTKILRPHMSIAQSHRGIGLGRKIYASFLAGDRVFVTSSHTPGASALWDSVAKIPGVSSFYVDDMTDELRIGHPKKNDYRFLGRTKLFSDTYV